MTLNELMIITTVLLGLAAIRFGLPLLLIWLFNLVCYRVLHLPR